MKIGLLCPASLPATQFGGIMFLCLDLAKELSKTNDVIIYTTDMDFANNPNTFNKKLPRVEKIDKFTIKRSHVWLSIKLFFINPGIYFQMKNDDLDIIHSIGIRSFQSFVGALISKKKKIPLVISDQGGLVLDPERENELTNKILRLIQSPIINFILKQATKISVANEYEKQLFSKYVDTNKIEIIRNGVNLETLIVTNKNFKEYYKIKNNFLLFLGRFNKVKGIDIILDAVNIIKNNSLLNDIQIVIMGVDFGYESEMLQIIKNYNLNEKITVIKNPDREYVLSAYQQCKFLILPSRWELSPLTPLEGFAFKKTVISTNAYGIPYTLNNNQNSILVESENPDELATAILDLLNDQDKCQTFGLNGYQLVHSECNSNLMAKNTLELYKKILQNPNI